MNTVRVATYNIHKGVQGLGPARRLEIHNLGHAVEQFDADIVCLQEVRKLHRKEAGYFPHWPTLPQADYLAPEGYSVVYRTNAITQHGEHGNAMLTRWPVLAHQHEDMSDHRFEQRGLLHSELDVYGRKVHVIVLHLGLIRSSRVRQLDQLVRYVRREIAMDAPLVVAGDFNDWGHWVRQSLARVGLQEFESAAVQPTYPSRLPLVQLDHVFARGMQPVGMQVPRGGAWGRMSDHLPVIAEFALAKVPA
jgi:endonuclease/exonuclease/phosphatase family metal-dependent hydrolase